MPTRTDALALSDSGQGRPVVLLHGLTCHLGYWLRVVPLLEGIRLVALDFRGHGHSGHRDSYRIRTTSATCSGCSTDSSSTA
ncbi:MAG TPA: alpha/beta fold hydrolase [Gaiellaceae bacterium]|nr:alpha/beta fold hydrolase [Gaiellaceae bacterium]